MLNHIVLMGRMTKDPVLNYTNTGTPVCSFTLAVDRDFANRQTGIKETDFIECVSWRKTAEFIANHFLKGQLTVVSGNLWMRDWTSKDGAKRRSAEVQVSSVYFGSSRSESTTPTEEKKNTGTFADLGEDDEDLPF